MRQLLLFEVFAKCSFQENVFCCLSDDIYFCIKAHMTPLDRVLCAEVCRFFHKTFAISKLAQRAITYKIRVKSSCRSSTLFKWHIFRCTTVRRNLCRADFSLYHSKRIYFFQKVMQHLLRTQHLADNKGMFDHDLYVEIFCNLIHLY